MKIAIDAAGPLSSFEKGGISYLLEDFLKSLCCAGKENRYLIFGYFWRNYRAKVKSIRLPEAECCFSKTLRMPGVLVKAAEERMRLPLIELFLLKENISIFHGISGGRIPLFKKTKTVLSVHDLAFEVNPSWFSENFYGHIRQSAKRADIIVTPSKSTKDELIRHYDINPAKIRVVYWGVNKEVFRPLPFAREEALEFKMPEEFILTVATAVERKNIPAILRVYKRLVKTGIRERLIIVAGSDKVKDRIKDIAEKMGLQGKIDFYSGLSKFELAFFYNRAKIFLFPSLYEGFGLPLVEAMACGCPTVTSNISSLPEIGGDAVISVNPYDEEALFYWTEKILQDRRLRDDMVQKGFRRAGVFSWEKTAGEMLNVYRETLISSGAS